MEQSILTNPRLQEKPQRQTAGANHRRPRVLRIIARLNTGGPARHVTLLSADLHKKGYPHLLVAGQVGRGEGSLQALAEKSRIPMEVLPALGPELSLGKDLLALVQLIRIIHRFRPDIVHTHTAKAGFVGRLAARLCGVPRVFHTYHGHVLRGYFPRPRQEIYRRLEALAGKWSTGLVTLTEGLAAELVDLGVAPREKFRVIPLGLDLAPFLKARLHPELKARLGLGATTTLMGCVGRLAPIKNLAAMLEAMKALPADWHLVLIGDGESRKNLEKQSLDWGLQKRIHFHGWCENLVWAYGGLDLVVNCSKNEGTPVSLLEAMVAGVPVVATPVGGVPELLQQTGTGLLLGGTSPEEISRGIKQCLASRTKQRPSKQIRAGIVQNFSVRTLVGRVEELYRAASAEPRDSAEDLGGSIS